MHEHINEALVERVYLYAYKRLHNRADAEDLAQDILTEALTAVARGRVVDNFQPWFWTLAHHRYCVFLSKRNRTPYTVSLSGGVAIEKPDPDFSVDEALLLREEIGTLNHVLSRLSREHREAVILFYLKEMKITDIARRLGLPVGTVKRRLFDARTATKKGLEIMEQNKNHTGTAAYAPAELFWWGGYSAPAHDHHIRNLLMKQIFIACRMQAKSINELADEIGVAPPYLEDTMQYALEHKLLKQTPGGKYLTDWCIMPYDAHAQAETRANQIYANIGAEIDEVLNQKQDFIRSCDFHGNDLPEGYLRWLWYVFACNRFANLAFARNEQNWAGKIAPNNGKNYRIAAMYLLADEEPSGYGDMKSVTWSNLHDHFEIPSLGEIVFVNFFDYEPFSGRNDIVDAANAPLIYKLIETNGTATLNDIETEQAAFLVSKGILAKDGDRLRVNIPVMSLATEQKILHGLDDLLQPLVDKYVDELSAMADNLLRPYIREDLLEEYAHWVMHRFFFPIGEMFYWAWNVGKTLDMPEDYSRSAAGLYIKY